MTLSAQLTHFGIHAVDLDRSNDEILAQTEAMCRSRPRFMTREAGMQSIQAKLDAR
jgi:hypothetical protein